MIVDTPGVQGGNSVDMILQQYLSKAFGFIYVINTNIAGGVQHSRVRKTLSVSPSVSLSLSLCPSVSQHVALSGFCLSFYLCTVCHTVCEFVSTTWIKQSDWWTVNSECGTLIYSAWKWLIMYLLCYKVFIGYVLRLFTTNSCWGLGLFNPGNWYWYSSG